MLTFIVILSAFLIFCKADLAEEFTNGYCAGRSGSIIVDNEKNSEVHFQSSFNVETATDTQLYNIIATALNLPRVDSPSSTPLPVVETSLFSKPNKNFFFSFEGLSLNEISVNKMKVIGKNALQVTRTSRPYSPASLLATTLTGQYPRSHGIIKGREPMKASHVNVMSVMAHVYPNAHVISGSYSHESALHLSSKKDGAYYWDNVKHSFKQATEVSGIPSVLIGDIQVSAFVKAFNAQSLFTKESWSLSMLRSELAFVWHAAAYLKDLDGTQFLNFHFQSIDMVRQEFGIASKEVEEAVSVMDSVLATIISGKVSYEMLYLPSLNNEESKSQVSLLSGVFPGLNLKTFPQIYLDSASENGEKSRMCNRIRELLQSSTTKVFCMFTQSEANSRLKRSEDANLATSDYTVTSFFEPVQAFHLYFWFFLFLIVVLGYSVYLLVGIEVDQGTVATSAYVQKKSNM